MRKNNENGLTYYRDRHGWRRDLLLGLSGYVWYHDNKRSKQADVQASAVSENNKVLGFLREKDATIAIHLRQNYPPIIIFPARNS